MTLEVADITFLEWLEANVDEIRAGGAVFQGQRITPDTEVVRYGMCWSLVFLTHWRSTDYFLKGTEAQRRGFITATAVTLLAGWWGIPFGLVLTPFYLIRNLTGGEKSTIGKLIAIMENPEQLQKVQSDVQLAPGKLLLTMLGGIILLCLLMQVYIYLRKLF
ncbi:MAG: hypothetical protein JNN26_20735 [Candidatus Obscuribacter sp.]|nr:hypothetical protein [Candidatus Obscuribacter sp.]